MQTSAAPILDASIDNCNLHFKSAAYKAPYPSNRNRCCTSPKRRPINGYIMLRKLTTGFFMLAFAQIITGCSAHHLNQTSRYAEVKFQLDADNFTTSATLVAGEASCAYILFTIPLCKNQSLAAIAWDKMRKQAQLDGKSAQIVNIFEDHSLRWNIFYIFYQQHYSVSGNVITYRQTHSDQLVGPLPEFIDAP